MPSALHIWLTVDSGPFPGSLDTVACKNRLPAFCIREILSAVFLLLLAFVYARSGLASAALTLKRTVLLIVPLTSTEEIASFLPTRVWPERVGRPPC